MYTLAHLAPLRGAVLDEISFLGSRAASTPGYHLARLRRACVLCQKIHSSSF
jgi:hypothetical protein